MMTQQQKDSIRDSVLRYIESFGSQNKAAVALDVAAATLSAIRNGDYAKISDEMWRNIASKVGVSADEDRSMMLVHTTVMNDLAFIMNENRVNRDFIWAISPAGSGKTIAAKMESYKPNTYYVLCDEDMKRREFALAFARSAGLRIGTQKNARAIIIDVVEHIREKQDVLIIFDEADKLSDNILNYFITIFNYFEDMQGSQTVGIQFVSTDYIATRMERGLRYKKKGYQELWSRLGAKFYEVDSNNNNDVVAICRARGIVNKRDIDAVVLEASRTNCDLRRVSRKINAVIRKRQAE